VHPFALHADILGGLRPSPVFIDNNGVSITSAGSAAGGEGIIYQMDNGSGNVPDDVTPTRYRKPTTWIITPRVGHCVFGRWEVVVGSIDVCRA
jgi:hypothetical protein